jgi:trimethylamine--corrinoid protein Co-methyltransferase
MSAYAQVCQYYKIPMWGIGGLSDSKVIDEQSAIEMTLGTFMSALSGVNLIHGYSQIESCMTGSIELVVMLDEVIGFIKKLLAGVNADNDIEIRELINKVGPGGHYISEEHTLKNFRSVWFPSIFDRNNFSRWKEEGSQDYKKRLNIRTREIVANYKREDLSKEILNNVEDIISKNK